MKHTKTCGEKILQVLSAILAVAGWLSTATVLATPAQAADKIREVNMGGYLMVAHSQAPASFNVGYSFYTAAWPLVEKYPGHRFQGPRRVLHALLLVARHGEETRVGRQVAGLAPGPAE